MNDDSAGFVPPLLECAELRLCALERAHSPGMFELWSDERVCRHSGPAIDAVGAPIALPATTAADSDRLLDFWLRRAEAGTGFRWAIIERPSDTFAGAIGFNALGDVAELAYHLVPRCWGRGLATLAAHRAIDWAVDAGSSTIECFVEAENTASIRLLERLGFETRGEARRCDLRFQLQGRAAPS